MAGGVVSRRDPEFVNLRWVTPDIYGKDCRQRRRLIRRCARRVQILGQAQTYNLIRRRATS